jgi:hypothetical protein
MVCNVTTSSFVFSWCRFFCFAAVCVLCSHCSCSVEGVGRNMGACVLVRGRRGCDVCKAHRMGFCALHCILCSGLWLSVLRVLPSAGQLGLLWHQYTGTCLVSACHWHSQPAVHCFNIAAAGSFGITGSWYVSARVALFVGPGYEPVSHVVLMVWVWCGVRVMCGLLLCYTCAALPALCTRSEWDVARARQWLVPFIVV